ncbi:hypothetical protein OF83DRAFT_76428 [Amylostereum chailletii]|nr:hypothetical protein OF83DRAFT_76428 [Amylostereum chailletii]
MQIYDSPHASTVTALFELPGMQNNEINVSVGRDGRLTVTGERRPPPLFEDPEVGRSRYPVSEIKYGKFERTVNIPPGIEVKDIVAGLTEGMLSISWPREVPRKHNSSPPVTSVQALIH